MIGNNQTGEWLTMLVSVKIQIGRTLQLYQVLLPARRLAPTAHAGFALL